MKAKKMVKFEDLGISLPILEALKEMGFEKPTEVQSKAIPHILNKEDIIVMSKTGSGKTAVFGIPVLQLADPSSKEPQGLILTPTRELAVQINNDIKQMGSHLKHRTVAVYGQHNINTEIKELEKGVSIVTGTPGRVYDHISHGNLKTKNIRFLVLDEADRMLDMGFIDQIKRIVKRVPKDRVTLLFSATIPNEIRRICSTHMKNPVYVEIESQTMTVDTVKQAYYRVKRNEKCTQLYRLLLAYKPESCIIFCNTKIAVDMVRKFLSRKGLAVQALHGDIPQGKRMRTIQQFKQNKFHILAATDVAARGIHIEDLSLVVNFDVPDEKDSYVHRIGRTGRAGKKGFALSLVTSNDIMSLYEIEEHIGVMIEEGSLPTDADLNADKEGIDKWLLKNKNNEKPKTPYNNTRKNSSAKQPYRKKQNYKSSGNRKPNNNVKSNRPVKPSAQPKASKSVEKSVKVPIKKQVEKTAVPVSPKINTTEVNKTTGTEKKSFIKRFINRFIKK